MSVTSFDLTGMTEAQKAELFAREAARPVSYTDEKGNPVSGEHLKAPPPEPHGPVPHPVLGFESVNALDPHIVAAVEREQGRSFDSMSGEEYEAALRHLASEKGWEVIWT